jgi:putative ABC transport system permease protein
MLGIVAITLQDLRFRARQFLIAVGGAGLVFAMGLLLSGLAAGFSFEIDQTVQAMGAQSWVLSKSATARLAGLPPIPASAVFAVAREPGVRRVGPLIVVPQAAQVGHDTRSVLLIGTLPGALGSTTVLSGRPMAHDGEAVVDARLGLGIGRYFVVSGIKFTVVGTVVDRTLLGGEANAYVTLADAQHVLYGGRALIGAVLVSGSPAALPAGLALYTNQQVEKASLHQLAPAVSSINNSRMFMWVIAAVIIAALVYVTALDRTRDFAVLKALGSSSQLLFVGLAIQAVLVALFAAVLAEVIANFMKGLFQQPVDIPGSAFVVLPLAAVVVGLLSSLAALRRAVSADPALAFAG